MRNRMVTTEDQYQYPLLSPSTVLTAVKVSSKFKSAHTQIMSLETRVQINQLLTNTSVFFNRPDNSIHTVWFVICNFVSEVFAI